MNDDQDTLGVRRHKAKEPGFVGFDYTDPDHPRPFQHNDGKPMTWLSIWMRKFSLSRQEASELLVGIIPNTVCEIFGTITAKELSGLMVRDLEIFDRAKRLAPLLPADYITPPELARWARSNGHDEWIQTCNTESSKLRRQEAREDVLRQWLTTKGYSANDEITETKVVVWKELSKIDNKLFPPRSEGTRRDFFRDAGLKFKRGYRPK